MESADMCEVHAATRGTLRVCFAYATLDVSSRRRGLYPVCEAHVGPVMLGWLQEGDGLADVSLHVPSEMEVCAECGEPEPHEAGPGAPPA